MLLLCGILLIYLFFSFILCTKIKKRVVHPENHGKAPKTIEWLTDNGSCYTATETRSFAKELGLKPVTTPVTSPQRNGMAESFVKTLKGTTPSLLIGRIQKLPLRRLTEIGNKIKIEASVLLGDEDEEVEVHGKPNCGDHGRRRRWVACG